MVVIQVEMKWTGCPFVADTFDGGSHFRKRPKLGLSETIYIARHTVSIIELEN